MRIGVVGAGGVGGLLAGLLARGGHDVALVARGAALEAIRERGLSITSPLGVFMAAVEVAATPHELAPVDVAFVAVKTWQVAEVAPALAPWLRPDGVVIPLENGVDAADECVAALGESRVVGGFCAMLSWIAAPGAIEHMGAPPRVTLGAWRTPLDARAEAFVTALAGVGVEAQIAPDFRAALWEKFLFIASFGGVGALTRATAGALRTVPETRLLLADAFEEVRRVAHAKGIALAPDIVGRTLAYVDGLPEAATASMQRDVVAGRPSELASLSGAVVRVAAEVGVTVPVHRAIHAALLPAERTARLRRSPTAEGLT